MESYRVAHERDAVHAGGANSELGSSVRAAFAFTRHGRHGQGHREGSVRAQVKVRLTKLELEQVMDQQAQALVVPARVGCQRCAHCRA